MNRVSRVRSWFVGILGIFLLVSAFAILMPQDALAAPPTECEHDASCDPSIDSDFRFCACHRTGPPSDPTGYDNHCSDPSSRSAHCCHGDLGGLCNRCGNQVRECCTFIDVGGTQVASDCCTLDTPLADPTNCANHPVDGCQEEECDDGDNDCNTNGCDANCHLTPNCDDGNPCTTDSCAGDGECSNTPNTDSCDDDNDCTSGEICNNGTCGGGSPIDCSDQDACTNDTCDPQAGCQYGPVECTDGLTCTTDSCDPATGCGFGTVGCDDQVVCTDDSCVEPGGCESTPNHGSCDDQNPCTDDSCAPGDLSADANGCLHVPNVDSCDDGNACTTGDTCDDGECVGGEPPDCEDGNICTDNFCDPQSGCGHTANTAPCDDGSQCTTGDVCSNEICVGGSAPNCDDGNVCTVDTCDPNVDGGCVNVAGNSGTECRASGGVCDPSEVCDGANAACPSDTKSTNACRESAGVCDVTENCDGQGNDCPVDGFKDNAVVCREDAGACDVGENCTGTGADCPPNGFESPTIACSDDGNICTDDFCDGSGECAHTPNGDSCDDNNVCTVGDTCSEGGCQPGGEPLNCDDQNSCTDDSCDPKAEGGCVHTPNNSGCDDGNACTTDDTCSNNECVGGAPLSCDDANPCTDDSCNPGGGGKEGPRFIEEQPLDPCVHTPDATNECTDGDACNGLEQCVLLLDGDVAYGATCETGAPPDCNDNDKCTGEICDVEVGCIDVPLPDSDNDKIPNVCDVCTGANDEVDNDGDSEPDACDNCPGDANPDQADGDSDGDGDACDDSGTLESCSVVAGNELPVVNFSRPKEVNDGVFEIPFLVEDPDGDSVIVKVTTSEGNAVINGGVITYTLPRPINKNTESVDVTVTVFDSGGCQETKFAETIFIAAGGDSAGCALIR